MAITATSDDRGGSALAEGNHRIANNLAIIASIAHSHARSLPANGTVQVNDIIHILNDLAAKIETVGCLHRLLSSSPEETSTVNLGVYLHEIATAAARSLTDSEQTELCCDLEPNCAISAKHAAAIGIFVVEALTNALKYSNPTSKPAKICLSCWDNSANLFIEIADNGVGLPSGFDPNTCGRTGLRLMRTIAEQLGGCLEFDRGLRGLRLRLLLPIIHGVAHRAA